MEHNILHEMLINAIANIATSGKFWGFLWCIRDRRINCLELTRDLGEKPNHITVCHNIDIQAGGIKTISLFQEGFTRRRIDSKCNRYQIIDPKWDNPTTTIESVAGEVLSTLLGIEIAVKSEEDLRLESIFNGNKVIGWFVEPSQPESDYE